MNRVIQDQDPDSSICARVPAVPGQQPSSSYPRFKCPYLEMCCCLSPLQSLALETLAAFTQLPCVPAAPLNQQAPPPNILAIIRLSLAPTARESYYKDASLLLFCTQFWPASAQLKDSKLRQTASILKVHGSDCLHPLDKTSCLTAWPPLSRRTSSLFMDTGYFDKS